MCADSHSENNEIVEIIDKTKGNLTNNQKLKAVEKDIEDFQRYICSKQPHVSVDGDMLVGAKLSEEDFEEYESMLRRRDELIADR